MRTCVARGGVDGDLAGLARAGGLGGAEAAGGRGRAAQAGGRGQGVRLAGAQSAAALQQRKDLLRHPASVMLPKEELRDCSSLAQDPCNTAVRVPFQEPC